MKYFLTASAVCCLAISIIGCGEKETLPVAPAPVKPDLGKAGDTSEMIPEDKPATADGKAAPVKKDATGDNILDPKGPPPTKTQIDDTIDDVDESE